MDASRVIPRERADPKRHSFDLSQADFTVGDVPGPPTIISAIAGDGSVTVSWSASDQGSSPVTRYTVTASPSGYSCSTTQATTCTVTRLANGKPHTFTVTAQNAAGTSLPSAASEPVTPMSITPGPVSGLTATPGKGRVLIRWSPPANWPPSDPIRYQYRVGRQKWLSTNTSSVTIKGARGKPMTVTVRAVTDDAIGRPVSVRAVPR